MLMHQRYFPLYDADGKLTNNFIVVSNGDPSARRHHHGRQRARGCARPSDAKFFYEEDLKHPLETYVDRLDEVVFQETLGTMKERLTASWPYGEASGRRRAAERGGRRRRRARRVPGEGRPRDERRGGVHQRAGRHGPPTTPPPAARATRWPAPSPTIIARASPATSLPRRTWDGSVAMADKLDTGSAPVLAVSQGPTSAQSRSVRVAAAASSKHRGPWWKPGRPCRWPPLLIDRGALGTYQDAGIDFDRDAIRAEWPNFFVAR